MKQGILLVLLNCFLFVSVSAQGHGKTDKTFFSKTKNSTRSSGVFTYTLTTLNEPYAELTGATSINNGDVWDDPEYSFSIPFPFMLNGNAISTLQFYGVGSLLQSATADPDILTAVFPFELDLIDRGYVNGISISPISYKVEGATGSRILKMEMKNAGSYIEFDAFGTTDMFINFQLWLYEGSNRVEFRFGENFINNPEIFYAEGGAFVGITDGDQFSNTFLNGHFLGGPASMPQLYSSDVTLEGTPDEGTVYRLSLDQQLEVTVAGQNSTSTCDPNGSATATASGGTEPYTYEWSNTETTPTISFLDAGTYSVTVTDADGNTAVGSVAITNVSPINPNASATDETSVDGNDGTATSSAFGGSPPYDFQWSNGEDTQTIFNLAPGLYTVTVTDSEGCFALESVIVGAFGCPEIILDVTVYDATCFGACDGEIDLEVTGGTAPYIYIWSNGLSSEDAFGLCAGDYSVTILDANGCTISGGPYTVSQSPEIIVNAGSTDETGPGLHDGTAWAAPTGGVSPFSYLWSNGSIDSLITGLSAGIYTVVVTDAQMCASISTVTVDSFACYLTDMVTHNTCYQSCDGQIEVTLVNAIQPVTYFWSNGSLTPVIDSLCAGTYGVVAQDASGCSAVGSYTVEEPEELAANAGHTDETSTGGNDGTAWAAPTGGTSPYTYLWSNNSTDSLITNLIPGNYTVTVTDVNNCSGTQSVDVNPFACAGIVQSGFVNPTCFNNCNGAAGAVLLGGVGPVTYVWSTGDTTNNISNLCQGTYEVTVTDIGENCVSIEAFNLVAPDTMVVTIDQLVHFTDITAGSIAITVSGGTSPYAYNWVGPNGYLSIEEDISGLAPGLYSLAVIDSHGCVQTFASVEVLDLTVSTPTLINVDVRIYPNPAKEQVYIDISDITGFDIQLRSFDGRLVRSWSQEKTLDVHELPAGVYVLVGVSGTNMFRQRLVIAR